jgi:hypothetical protein
MRYFSSALLMLSLAAAASGAQASRGAPPRPTPVPAIVPRVPIRSLAPIQLEDQWTTALVKRDTRTFDRLLAPNFVYTENGSVMNRGDVIKSVTGPDKVDWARNEGMQLHDFGSVHVITGVLHLRGKDANGRAFDRRYQFTDTWQQQRDGRWQIIAAQDYLFPPRVRPF